ncbi:hypothetical protein C4A76_23890 [Brevibacillus laterosporus]|uniref:hypothetical protein n=1 Tax=Brevibacillus laterosporus TaxID=1465 RepID=UPI000CE4347F|nr:hypothetical protein [Brevibacillus laterosporus]PPA81216.1 hypothetical protein C4A76_23890 [Brevibacillus laterosporus]
MKKNYFVITVLALAVGLGSSFIFNEVNNSKSSHGHALAKSFKSTEELVEDANLIVNAEIDNNYTVEKFDRTVFHVYKIKINKIYSNSSEQEFSEGDTVELFQLVGRTSPNGENIAYLFDEENVEITQGDYLLFLHSKYDENFKKNTVASITTNQLFKAENKRSLSTSNIFNDVWEQRNILSINEEELMEIVSSKNK